MVAGWRQKRQDGFLLRKLPSMIANRLIRKVSGLEFKDLGCSLKAFRGDVLRQVRLYGEMHRFIPAWLATVTSPGRMAEEPVRHHARVMGESKYGISRTFRVIVDLLAMHYFLRFGTRPGHFFGGFGLILSAIGGLMLAYLGVLKLLGEDVGGRPLLWLGFCANRTNRFKGYMRSIAPDMGTSSYALSRQKANSCSITTSVLHPCP